MEGKRIITICQSGGEFFTEKDGTLSYRGGDAHAIDIDEEVTFNEFKMEVSEMFGCNINNMSIKYFLPGNKKTLITVSNDKDLMRMIKFLDDFATVDIYVMEETVAPEVSNMPASRSSRTTLSETVLPVDDVALDVSEFVGDTPQMKTRNEGVLLLSLLFLTFVAQIINVWYALMKFILRFSQPQKNSFKLGLKFAAKGLILPFLPKKQWPRVIPASSHPKTGLPPGPDTKSGRRDMTAPGGNTVSAMAATVVPVLSPGSPGPNVRQMTAGSSTPETTLDTRRAVEAKQLKGQKLEPKSDLKKLRALAKASFSGDTNFEEASTSYVPKP